LLCACLPLQKYEEEQRLVELQRQLQDLEQQERRLTSEARELGLDAAQASLGWEEWVVVCGVVCSGWRLQAAGWLALCGL
jgi:hypothetical protein